MLIDRGRAFVAIATTTGPRANTSLLLQRGVGGGETRVDFVLRDM